VMGLAPQPFLVQAKPSVDRLIVRMQAAEQRLRQSEPGLRPLVGTEPAALAFARPPAIPAAAPDAAPTAPAAPAHGSH
jgi:hypothetical protein